MDLDKLREVLAGAPSFRLKQAYQAVFVDLSGLAREYDATVQIAGKIEYRMSAGSEGDAFRVAKERELENIAGIAGRGESGVGAAETRGRKADGVRFRAGRMPAGVQILRNRYAGIQSQSECGRNRGASSVFLPLSQAKRNRAQPRDECGIYGDGGTAAQL